MSAIQPDSPSALPQPVSTALRRRSRRAIAVASATAATSLLWLGAHAVGVDFHLTDSIGSVVSTLPVVVSFTLVFAMLGWGTLAVLERLTRHARTAWTALAITVVLLSLLPILAEHATAGTKIALTPIHLAVAATLVPQLRRSSSG